MEVLFAYKSHAAGAQDPYTSLLPLGLGYLHAVMKSHGYSSQVANFSSCNWQKTESVLSRLRPDIIGISQFTHNRTESLKLATLAKKINPQVITVFGGPHATHQFHEILTSSTDVDIVVLGEGEETFLELVNSVSGKDFAGLTQVRGIAFRGTNGVERTERRPPIADMDAIPFPARYLEGAIGVELHRQLEFIVTSRGCPASCLFCASPLFWGRSLRFRNPENVVEEIAFIRDQYGLIYFSIRDDTFTADKARVLTFCQLLRSRKLHIVWNCQSRVNALDEEMLVAMKQAGCECIQLGVESGSPAVLKTLGKGIQPHQIIEATGHSRRIGLNVSVYLIAGVAHETEDDLNASIKLIEKVRPQDGQVSPLAYYPGTKLFTGAVAAGVIDKDIFLTDKSPAIFVNAEAEMAARKLLAGVTRTVKRSGYKEKDFLAQKKILGYCHVTNMMAGEFHEEQGQWHKAEMEYQEIVKNEPQNPWGWLLLGGLYGRAGELKKAVDAFKKVLEIVPAHAPAYAATGELLGLLGKQNEAKDCYKRALALDPYDLTAKEGLRSLAKK